MNIQRQQDPMPMTVSAPYVDPRSKRKNSPQWLVSVGTVSVDGARFMRQQRFESWEEAEAFSAEHRLSAAWGTEDPS